MLKAKKDFIVQEKNVTCHVDFGKEVQLVAEVLIRLEEGIEVTESSFHDQIQKHKKCSRLFSTYFCSSLYNDVLIAQAKIISI